MLVAFGISTLTSMGGVSGAFLILPFQVSILGFTGPAVSPTNLVFNIVAIPSGVVRYWREKRLVWSLTWTIIIGTLPGVFLGAIIRIKYLPDPRAFKVFAGMVLLYIAIRLVLDFIKKHKEVSISNGKFEVTPVAFNIRHTSFDFNGVRYKASIVGLLALSFVVGIVGGTYGIGGGAIIAPFLIAVFGLPVYAVAGAALLGTFITSIAGVVFYTIIAPFYGHTGLAISPDWLLGAMFGIGGAAGMYVGARLQRFIPARIIKIILAAMMLFIAVKYISGIIG